MTDESNGFLSVFEISLSTHVFIITNRKTLDPQNADPAEPKLGMTCYKKTKGMVSYHGEELLAQTDVMGLSGYLPLRFRRRVQYEWPKT